MESTDANIASLFKEVKLFTFHPSVDPNTAQSAEHSAFEEFASKINLGVAFFSTETHYKYVSKSFAQITGININTIYRDGPNTISESVLESDKPLVTTIIERSKTAIETYHTSLPCIRISFDYRLRTEQGNIKRIYQHLLPNAVAFNDELCTLQIVHDYTGFKRSHSLNYRVSFMPSEGAFETIASGKIPPLSFPIE